MLELRRILITVVIAALSVCAASASGQRRNLELPPKAAQGAAQRMVERWDDLLRQADDALRSGEPKKTLRRTAKILADCRQAGLSGEAITGRLAMTFVLQALAHHGLGDRVEARWRWDSARALLPAVEEWDLSGYGESGAALAAMEGMPEWEFDGATVAPRRDREVVPGVEKPVKKRAPVPDLPRSRNGQQGTLVLRCIVGPDGRLYNPSVEPTNLPATYVAVALDTWADWRFEPARMNGRPMAVFFSQTLRVRW